MECKKIFRAVDMKILDDYTVRREPVEPIDLMERAARAFVDRLLELYPRETLFQIAAGAGNNGGDGYAAGRLLLERGREARVHAVHVSERLSPCCAANRERFLAAGGSVTEVRRAEDLVVGGGTWIDALFGVGLDRPLRGWVAEVVRRVNESGRPVVAVDIPSGLMGEDNRENDGAIVRAARTLTFHGPKLAFMLEENYPHAGEFETLDIGLHPEICRSHPSSFFYLTREAVASALPGRDKFARKGTRGRALLVAGSSRMMGAALLAARGALRSGVGLLTLHVPRSFEQVVHAAAPEALVDADADDCCFTGARVSAAYDAVGIGPGLGMSPESAGGLWRLLEEWSGRLVLDADALNLVAAEPGGADRLPAGCVLTPHAGEFERLAGRSSNDFDRLNKLINFATRHRLYVALKGAHTAVATPSGRCYFNTSGNPGMAKGGAGDVLTGVIAALLAGGMAVEDAVLAGVYAHGVAGDLAAREHGERGMTSGDVAAMMGKAWQWCERQDV
ncbi:MAG: NAD(P)H-hydrate dehydratase [Odoribacteraceae bacterium]|jgi:NAD(P)H-hydrate epimerase|nr:NAD(P)H-hydrate dehydratase [Odoribacteraceae bacterium]